MSKKVIEAAGTVTLREEAGKRQVLLVHRPSYDDWSLPKGHLEPDEYEAVAAGRETWEETGVTVALGADCNPGTSYTTSLPFVIALAVRELCMTPAEALWSATAGGARALRRDDVGHLGVGARADLAVLDAPSYLHLAYRPGVPLVRDVLKDGRRG